MENLKTYKMQVKEIEGLVEKLESGDLGLDELLILEKLTRELHEKSIILKYKAFENQVKSNEDIVEEAEEKPVFEPVEETTEEEEIEFAIFGAPDSAEEPAIQVEEIEESVTVEEPEAPEVKEEVIPEVEPEVTPEPIKSEEVEPEAKVEEIESAAVESQNTGSIWEQINIADNSLSSQFADSKIDTLVGAFGLNQKLRYINDLFDGSSEFFGDAVKLLDGLNGLEEAKNRVNDLAQQHEWDPEEESVVEFIAIVNRRYA